MKKLSYGEQLKHPNWQRVRLERLDAAGWKCQACGDKETTLHVHHKRYLKGRMAWDYPPENFAVLCDPCHAEAHAQLDEMHALLADLNPQDIRGCIDLLVGWKDFQKGYGGRLSRKHPHKPQCLEALLGLVAWDLQSIFIDHAGIADLSWTIDMHEFRQKLVQLVSEGGRHAHERLVACGAITGERGELPYEAIYGQTARGEQ